MGQDGTAAWRQRVYDGSLDVSSRAGFLLGAVTVGLSYQPNLLSRGTRDQAIISGVGAGVGYAWGSAAHSFLRSVANRVPGAVDSRGRAVAAGAVVDSLAAAAGFALTRIAPPQEHEPSRQALVRLAGVGAMSAGAAGVVADLLETTRGRPGFRALGLATALAGTAGAYALSRRESSQRGSASPDGSAAHEDVVRETDIARSLLSGMAVTAALGLVARGESVVATAAARAAAAVLGGAPADHRTVGRVAAAATLAGLGWGAVTAANHVLTKAGVGDEPAHHEPPTVAEVTGGPGSHVPWADQTRESRRWLTMTLSPEEIAEVMGEPARQPIRVYASLEAAATPAERAALLLAEIDRTGALDRPYFALFSPTGSGYVNYVATETYEYLTRGDCASAAIQYSVLPSALSLTQVRPAAHQTRLLVNGIVERLLDRPADRRPTFLLFGESLGSQVSEEMFAGTGVSGPAGIGLTAAVWIGTPASTLWRKELWGTRTVAAMPGLGPAGYYLPRAVRDWHALAEPDRTQVRFLLLQNGADPVPKFEAPLVWRRPDWLGPDASRPPGAPRGTRWLPVVTFVTTFIDLQNALVPTPGRFQEGGHDYRREIPEAVRQVFALPVGEDQMERVQAALRARELRWEIRRRLARAEAMPGEKRAAAEQQLVRDVSRWTGHDVDMAEVGRIAAGAAVPAGQA